MSFIGRGMLFLRLFGLCVRAASPAHGAILPR
jgi:hypothetical protein